MSGATPRLAVAGYAGAKVRHEGALALLRPVRYVSLAFADKARSYQRD